MARLVQFFTLVALVAVVSSAGTHTPTPTSTPVPTPTPSPTLTSTSVPTATPTATPTLVPKGPFAGCTGTTCSTVGLTETNSLGASTTTVTVYTPGTLTYVGYAVTFAPTTGPVTLSGGSQTVTQGSSLIISGQGMSAQSGTIDINTGSSLSVLAPVTSTGVVWTILNGFVTLSSTFTQTAPSASDVLLTLSSEVSGTGSFVNRQGIMQFILGGLVKSAVTTGAVSTSAQSRHLSATTITSTVSVCGAMIGSGSVSVTSGGALDITQSCLYTGSVIVNSLTVPISVSSTTDVTTTTTIASGAYLQLLSVGTASYLSNFEGNLVFSAGSSLVVSLAAEPTYRYTNTIIRYEAVTCDISTPSVSFLNCGLWTCSIAVAEEVAGESCLVTLTVGLSDDDSSAALWWLFMLFFVLPVVAAAAYVCSRKEAEAGLHLTPDANQVSADGYRTEYAYPNSLYGNSA